MTIVTLYARVSTNAKGQRTENQLPELRRFA
jgi:DNA invertase Pin-like site-specific DNA recombinase